MLGERNIMSGARDVFKFARDREGGLTLTVGDENIPMLLSYIGVRQAAKDWKTYSSNAPFRVPIPSEEAERSVRQLPIETDPPEHKKYRALLEPFFRRPMQPAYVDRIDKLITRTIRSCATRSSFDVVREFALPIQSYALTYLLGVAESEAETWISWGTHVFHDGDGETKGAALEAYLQDTINAAKDLPDTDNFFAALNHMKIDDRPLNPDEKLGLANLVFAGGRDTVINAISFVVSTFAEAQKDLIEAASDERKVNLAVEEIIRVLSPLTQIGRVCHRGEATRNRVSLCWAAANYDPEMFKEPETLNLTRSPNPHVGFGSGHHTCLGAPQVRTILRSLIRNLAEHVSSVRIEGAIQNIEHYGSIQRDVGFERLMTSLDLRNS